MPVKKKNRRNDFEKSLEELEKLVTAMESGELSLEESLEYFERGVKQIRACQKVLDEAEQKIKILMDEQLESFDQE